MKILIFSIALIFTSCFSVVDIYFHTDLDEIKSRGYDHQMNFKISSKNKIYDYSYIHMNKLNGKGMVPGARALNIISFCGSKHKIGIISYNNQYVGDGMCLKKLNTVVVRARAREDFFKYRIPSGNQKEILHEIKLLGGYKTSENIK